MCETSFSDLLFPLCYSLPSMITAIELGMSIGTDKPY
jgi:hypothetical protein